MFLIEANWITELVNFVIKDKFPSKVHLSRIIQTPTYNKKKGNNI